MGDLTRRLPNPAAPRAPKLGQRLLAWNVLSAGSRATHPSSTAGKRRLKGRASQAKVGASRQPKRCCLIIETRARPSTVPDLGLPPFLQDALAARGINSAADLALPLADLVPPTALPGIEAAVDRLAAAIANDERILIAGDFDADGATASALCVSLLRAFGAGAGNVDFLVPNRFEHGYGLTPELVRVALGRAPDVVVTVDNGVSSLEGVELAQTSGVDVVVTDHHLPGEELPAACAIVNPNLADSTFPSRHLAGVGVAYYLMGALRAALRAKGHFERNGIVEPRLADWLDLVAVGTVADVVPLDRNNRILVQQGLRRLRAGHTRPGIQALVEVGKRSLSKLGAGDLGFSVGPRLNAAGRLQDMAIGIKCLLSEDLVAARQSAAVLDELNAARREIDADMSADAAALVEDSEMMGGATLCVYQPHWHEGVIGIVAGRMRERYHRPAIAFADAASAPDELKGSARSIPGLHIRDAIAAVAARHPGLIGKFGGHAMAAGMSIRRPHLPRFQQAFEAAVAERVSAHDLAGIVLTDGELEAADLTLENARLIAAHGPWGQGFEEPRFHGEFDVVARRVVGERHLKLVLRRDERIVDAIAFNQEPVAGDHVRAAYRLGVNDYGDAETLQLELDRIEAC